MIFHPTQTKFNKTVLVLGSNSFIGKNIIEKIPYKKIICIQKNKTENSTTKIKYYYFDLLNFQKLKKIVYKYKFDKIINCASNNNNSLNANNNNIRIFQQNTNILLNILEIFKFNRKIEIINFNSTETFKKFDSIYSISKKINNELCKFYQKNYNLKIRNLTLANVFGQNDLNFKRIIPMLIKKKILRKNINIINNTKKINFTFIDNVLKMIIDPKKKINQSFLISIKQLQKKIKHLISPSSNKKKIITVFDYQLYQTVIWYQKFFTYKKL